MFTYSYVIKSSNVPAGTMEVEYSSEGYDPITVFMPLPVQNQEKETIIKVYAPVMNWLNTQKVFVDVETGQTGSVEVNINLDLLAGTRDATLEELKRDKANKINAYRAELVASGITYNGNQFASDLQTVTMLSAISGAGEVPDGFTFRSVANVDVPMTYAQTVELLKTIVLNVNAIYNESWSLKAAIDAATTKEELDAVVWIDETAHGEV